MVRTLRHGEDIRVNGSNAWEDSFCGVYDQSRLWPLGISQRERDNDKYS